MFSCFPVRLISTWGPSIVRVTAPDLLDVVKYDLIYNGFCTVTTKYSRSAHYKI
jgi:hypothetical protein